VGSDGFRLRLVNKDSASQDIESQPGPHGEPAISIQLRVGDDEIGVLHLHGGLTEEARRLADWGGRLLAKGVRNARRLDGSYGQRTYEDVQAMLARTPLTPRERDVVGRLLSGASTRQIAKSTGLTVATVNTYLKRIFAKLGVHSRVELVARVTGTRGVIPPGPKVDASTA